VAHGDAVVHANGVKNKGHAAGFANALLYVIANFLQVNVAGDDVNMAVANRDKGFIPVIFTHTGSSQEAAVSGAMVATLDSIGSGKRLAVGIGAHLLHSAG
jgi:hypothetical protein